MTLNAERTGGLSRIRLTDVGAWAPAGVFIVLACSVYSWHDKLSWAVVDSVSDLSSQTTVLDLSKRSTLLWRLKSTRAGITLAGGTITLTWTLVIRLFSVITSLFVVVFQVYRFVRQ
jgi:hypothetical protein